MELQILWNGATKVVVNSVGLDNMEEESMTGYITVSSPCGEASRPVSKHTVLSNAVVGIVI